MPTLNFPSPDVANPGDKVHTGDVTWVFTDKGFWSSEVGEAGGGASVHYGPTAPDSPSQGDLWYADDSTVEFGGRLYIYTGTEWVDTSLPGGGSGESGGTEVGSLQTVTDNGAVTTNACEFGGGVKVTGGTIDLTSANGEIAYGTSPNGLTNTLQIKGTNSGQYLQFYEGGTRVVGGNNRVGLAIGGLYSGTSFSANNTGTQVFTESSNYADASGNINKSGFYASPVNLSFSSGDTGYYRGFFSSVSADTTSGNNLAYNFYAAGTAPNYFAGLTEHAGGVKATGQNGQSCFEVPPDVGGTSDIVGYKFGNTSGTGAYSTGFLHTGVGDGLVQYSTGFQAMENVGRGTVSCIGFQSSLKANGNKNYNFYAGGSAPNYFYAGILAGTDTWNDTTNAAQIEGGRVRVAKSNGRPVTESPFEVYRTNTSGSEPYYFLMYLNGATAGVLQLNSTDQPVLTNISDYRLKSNITPLSNAVNLVKQLKPCEFSIGVHDNVRGFIAHELQEISPECVVGTKDETESIGTLADYDGTVLETEVTEPSAEDLTYTEEVEATPYVAAVAATYDEYGTELTAEVPEAEATYTTVTRTRTWTPSGTRPVYQGVDQTKLIPLLTKALQEALTEIDDLKTRLAALEGA